MILEELEKKGEGQLRRTYLNFVMRSLVFFFFTV
jgi:hypothetical protein